MSGMDRLTELLPCPFCGGTNQTRVEGDRFWCHAIMCPCGLDYSGGDELAGCIDAWNSRASQAATAPSDGLREALEAIRDGYGPNHLSKFALAIASAALMTPAPAQEGGE